MFISNLKFTLIALSMGRKSFENLVLSDIFCTTGHAKITIKGISILSQQDLIKGQQCERLCIAPDEHIVVSCGYNGAQLAKSESAKIHGSVSYL